MVSFVALYRGKSLSDSELIAVSTDPYFVGDLASNILKNQAEPSADPAIAAVTGGKRRALRIIKRDAQARVNADEKVESV